jgi:hypothetical protein
MFRFTVKYFGSLKRVPLSPQIFESWLKIGSLVMAPQVLTVIDEIETEVSKWDGITIGNHKYGGIQFNRNGREIGHIHGNGMLDIPLTRKLKLQFIEQGKLLDHHTIKDTGWSSFEIHNLNDKTRAIELLRESYELRG